MASSQQEEESSFGMSSVQIEAIQAQTCYLPLFRTEPTKKSFGRKGALRLSIPEIVWIVIMIVVLFWVFVGLFWLPQMILPQLVNKWVFAAPLGAWLGWKAGRKMAGASPYRQSTNEGMVQYLRVRATKLTWIPSYLFDKPVVTNVYPSLIEDLDGTGDPIHVECVEWIGTMRAPYAPAYNSRVIFDNAKRGITDPNADANYIYFVPQNYGVF